MSTFIWEGPTDANGCEGPADFVLISADDKVIKAHRSVLQHATEMFSNLFATEHVLAPPVDFVDGVPKLTIHEHSTPLAIVVQLCYNIPPPDLKAVSHDDLCAAYRCAHMFVAFRAVERVRGELMRRLRMDDSRLPAQATPAPPVSMKDTAMRGLQVFAMARQHHDDELAEATREPALSQFDLNNPMYLFGQIGQDEWLDLNKRKATLKEDLFGLLSRASIVDLGTDWTCCETNEHLAFCAVYSEWIASAVRATAADGKRFALPLHRMERLDGTPHFLEVHEQRLHDFMIESDSTPPMCSLWLISRLHSLRTNWIKRINETMPSALPLNPLVLRSSSIDAIKRYGSLLI